MGYPSFLYEPKGPWLLSSKRELKWEIREGFLELRLNARRMSTLSGFFDEVSSVFRFPSYFGKNLNATWECINDLEWLPSRGYVVVVAAAETFLCDEPDDTLAVVLQRFCETGAEWAEEVSVGDAWDREAIPFHTILEFSCGINSPLVSRVLRLTPHIYDLDWQ